MAKRNNVYIIDTLFAILLGIMAIACFILQILTIDSKNNQNAIALFNILQFILTMGCGLFSTRAISRVEFERETKKFAVGAYRRITDIQGILDKLRLQVANMLEGDLGDKSHGNLKIVSAIVEDMKQIVKSSIADWADIIGEEIITLQKINVLENEKENLDVTSTELVTINEKLNSLNTKIIELRSKLPISLRIPQELSNDNQISKNRLIYWMVKRHQMDDGLVLEVVSGKNYGDEKITLQLKPKDEIQSALNPGGGLDVITKKGQVIGRLINITPFSYDDFVRTIEGCYGTNKLTLEFIKLVGESVGTGGTLIRCLVKVKNTICVR